MKERIKKIIDYENITYGEFADKVGIQRSGVSHLISGRNNPSLDVIQKILEAYDYINTEWLLLGKGEMIKEKKTENKSKTEIIQGSLFSEKSEKENEKITDKISSSEINNFTDDTDKKNPDNSQEVKIKPEKSIERVIIFYSDKSFSEYKPE